MLSFKHMVSDTHLTLICLPGLGIFIHCPSCAPQSRKRPKSVYINIITCEFSENEVVKVYYQHYVSLLPGLCWLAPCPLKAEAPPFTESYKNRSVC